LEVKIQGIAAVLLLKVTVSIKIINLICILQPTKLSFKVKERIMNIKKYLDSTIFENCSRGLDEKAMSKWSRFYSRSY
jgi:hypothetical protein